MNDAKYKIDIFLLVLPIVSKVSVNSKTLGGDPVETFLLFYSTETPGIFVVFASSRAIIPPFKNP